MKTALTLALALAAAPIIGCGSDDSGSGSNTDTNKSTATNTNSGSGTNSNTGTASKTGTGTAGKTGTDTGSKTGTASATSTGCNESDLKSALTVNGNKRFFYGVNYAWQSFGVDFGGKSAWSQKGVAANKETCTKALQEMKDNGVDVVRWWMFPDLRGDGIKLDTNKTPSGLGATVVDDINAALQIAKDLDIHIELTIFSFDNFRADDSSSGSVDLGPIVADDTKRAALMENVVRPIAKAVAASPNKDRMVSWDVINEPEWAIASGTDGYGDQAFDCNTKLNCIPFTQMETFVKDVVKTLKSESTASVTVGSAAVKWAKAWSKCDLDHYDFHWYGWVDQWFPHTRTPADYGVDDKPVVVGEFPVVPNADTTGKSFDGISYDQLVTDFLTEGYAGAQGWAYSDTTGGGFSWANGKTAVKAWADAHACLIHF